MNEMTDLEPVAWGVLGVADIAVAKVIPAMAGSTLSRVEAIASRSPELPLVVDRERARFGAWYELFPRSQGRDPQHPTATTFATYIEAIRPQAMSGCCSNSSGPGVMLNISRAPRRIAVVPLPGMPNVSIGTMAPAAEALFAASGAARPRISP